MATLAIHKQTALPGTLEAHSIYIIAPPAKPDFVEIYVTDASAVAKRLIDEARVQELIDATPGVGAETLDVVADIAARDALTPDRDTQVMVLDASADATVASGAATYVYDLSTTTWHKISEAESLDLVLNWAGLADKPTSAVADIDDAVTKRHTHANKTQLDKIDQDGDGNLTYDGALPATGWASTGW